MTIIVFLVLNVQIIPLFQQSFGMNAHSHICNRHAKGSRQYHKYFHLCILLPCSSRNNRTPYLPDRHRIHHILRCSSLHTGKPCAFSITSQSLPTNSAIESRTFATFSLMLILASFDFNLAHKLICQGNSNQLFPMIILNGYADAICPLQ